MEGYHTREAVRGSWNHSGPTSGAFWAINQSDYAIIGRLPGPSASITLFFFFWFNRKP